MTGMLIMGVSVRCCRPTATDRSTAPIHQQISLARAELRCADGFERLGVPLSSQIRVQWATVVVIEQMQRWRCPTYTPRTTVIAPYSSTEVVHALPEAEKHTLLFFRRGLPLAWMVFLMGMPLKA